MTNEFRFRGRLIKWSVRPLLYSDEVQPTGAYVPKDWIPSLKFLDHLRHKDQTFYVDRWFAQSGLERGLLLDLPAGTARSSANIAKRGFKVVSCDLFPARDVKAFRELNWIQADMSASLPFEDETFDYVLNSEGIEHISDQFAFLRECRRVLKPGGSIAITTPNLLSLRSRAAFMLAGNRAFKSFVDEETSVWKADGNKIYHGHAFLINYFQLRYMLRHSGFTIREIVGTHYNTTSLLLFPVLAPLVHWFTRKAMRKAIRKNPGSLIYDEIKRHVFSPQMLLSKNLFVVAQLNRDVGITRESGSARDSGGPRR